MSVEQPSVDPRASDADRERAAALVQQAHADGRLDFAEMDERLARVFAAKTRSELAGLTADVSPGAHGRVADVLTLSGKWSAHERSGRWLVPPRIVVQTSHGNVRLDFTQAVVTTPEVHIEIEAKGMGNLLLVVPEGWAADLDGVKSKNGDIRNKARAPEPGAILLRVTGQLKDGDVKVRHPRPPRWWRRKN